MNADEIRLLDGDFYAGDPYPTYAWLRENSPIHRDEMHGVWGISRFADVVAIEKNPKLYSSLSGSRPRTAPLRFRDPPGIPLPQATRLREAHPLGAAHRDRSARAAPHRGRRR